MKSYMLYCGRVEVHYDVMFDVQCYVIRAAHIVFHVLHLDGIDVHD